MSLVSGWMSSAGSVLTLNSRDVDEGVCDGKKKKKTPWRRPCEAQRFCPTEGVLRSRLFFFYRLQINEGAGICCVVIVPLFLLALFFLPLLFPIVKSVLVETARVVLPLAGIQSGRHTPCL